MPQLSNLVEHETCKLNSIAMNPSAPRVIVALDYPDAATALQFVDRVNPAQCRLKVGKELFTAAGPELVTSLVGRGFDVFLDLKFHDIPNTVARAVAVAARLGDWMTNVHALGGSAMLNAARDAAADSDMHLIAVSILTSTDQAGIEEIGIHKPLQETVMDLTAMSLDCGLDGMVCSAREAALLREKFGTKPLLVTPGIRPAGVSNDDQQRIMTPAQAIAAGSSYLVIGRPVTAHDDPLAQLESINASLSFA